MSDVSKSLPERQLVGERMTESIHYDFFDINDPPFSELSNSARYDVVDEIVTDLRAYQLYLLTCRH